MFAVAQANANEQMMDDELEKAIEDKAKEQSKEKCSSKEKADKDLPAKKVSKKQKRPANDDDEYAP